MSKPTSLSFRTAVLWLTLTAGLAAAAPAEDPALHALELNGTDFRIIDRTTGADVATINTSVSGSWRGIARSPVTGILYASDTEYLFKLDAVTGATTQIGLYGSVVIRDLTFDADGQLYGVTGVQGEEPGSPFRVDTETGFATFVLGLNGNGGHAIAGDPEQPGTLYHLAIDTLLDRRQPGQRGDGSEIFERVDQKSGIVTPIGLSGDAILGRPLGLVYDPFDGVLRFFDNSGFYYSVTLDGTVVATGLQNPACGPFADRKMAGTTREASGCNTCGRSAYLCQRICRHRPKPGPASNARRS